MNFNLTNFSSFKELLLKKLSYAVTCSVLSHLSVVLLYIVIVNFSIQPAEWFKFTFDTLTSFSTWLHLIPFASIIFAQVVICAKDYVLTTTYHVTRFQRAISIFSVRTFILGLLHVIVGGLAIWLYLSLGGGHYQALFVECKENDYCLAEGNFFMILSGLWTGLYFFVRLYVGDRNLIFPVVQQRKLLRFKATFLPLLKDSKKMAMYPTVYYFILYYVCGSHLCSSFAQFLKLRLEREQFSFWLYGYTWIFTTLYITNMNLMRFFFELFLTEPIEHPVMVLDDNDASLSEALLLHNIPILRHLACLELYLLSIWSPQRRRALFTLSQPGGHPHAWNRLIQGTLKLMSEFTDTLNKSTDVILSKEEKPKASSKNEQLPLNNMPSVLQSPLQKPQKHENIRNMSLLQPSESIDIISVSQQRQQIDASLISRAITETTRENFTALLERIKNIRTIKYIFGELPEVRIQQCLRNGQLIVWTTQGLANVAVSSFKEDPYGIVQKDLPVLITCLVQLKQSVDKLNKVPLFSRRGPGFDDFSYKMCNSVNAAVRRSLCNICKTFGTYLNDIPLKRDISAQLQCYL